MKIIVPGSFGFGLVGQIVSPDAKLLVQANSFQNFIDMSGNGSALVPAGGVSLSQNGIVTKGANAKVKTSVLDNSDGFTLRSLVRVQRGSEGNVTVGVLGSFIGLLGGVGLHTWHVESGGYSSLQVRLAYAAKNTTTNAKLVGVAALVVNGQSGLSAPVADTGWLYIVGKLDGVSKKGKLRIMNTGQAGDVMVADENSALALDRGTLDELGNPLTHSLGSVNTSIGGRTITTAKAEVFDRVTSDIEDEAQYAADKKYLCPAFGISTVGWV